MSESQPPRSVKIGVDERTGWSSDRPRKEGGRPHVPDVSVRCEVLSPSDRLRYSPGSLLLIASPSGDERDRFAERVIEERGALLSLDKVRGLLAGRVDDAQVDDKARELLDAAVLKRLEASETVVVPLASLDFEERDRYVRMADRFRRPRHMILLDTPEVSEDDKANLADLRKALMAGELGGQGFHTALRLSGGSIGEVKKILFRPAPRNED